MIESIIELLLVILIILSFLVGYKVLIHFIIIILHFFINFICLLSINEIREFPISLDIILIPTLII